AASSTAPPAIPQASSTSATTLPISRPGRRTSSRRLDACPLHLQLFQPGGSFMHGKVIVITGASGALGKVVADAAIARGARVAGINRAAAKGGTTADRIDLGGVDLSDAAQAKQAVDAAAA